jgi:hypothetical protein
VLLLAINLVFPTLSGLALLHLVQLSYLVEQLASLQWVRDPRCRASQSCLEIVCPCTQELISNMQCLPTFDPSKDALAGQYTPRLVSNIYKHIIAPWPLC